MTDRDDARKISAFRRGIFQWSRLHGRDLPWRGSVGPWGVLVSELMLQQTQVRRVIPKYAEFMRRWPTPAALAGAALKDVLAAWSGLGYNRRAIGLWKAAREIAEEHRGEVPATIERLESLPGIGRYTARAIASFAFNADAALWDTNVRRIFLRVFFGGEFARRMPAPAALEALLERVLPRGRSGSWHGALMDFGSAVCVGRAPDCAACPLAGICRAAPFFVRGEAPRSALVRKQPKFEGSRRQARGMVLKMLARRGRPVPVSSLARLAPGAVDAVEGLVADGLAKRTGNKVTLP